MEVNKELADAAPGVLGSIIALLFLRRPLFVALGMVVGGSALSYFSTPVVLDAFPSIKFAGFAGFMLGLFGMALVSKMYDAIEQINLGELWAIIKAAIRKKLGLSKEGSE